MGTLLGSILLVAACAPHVGRISRDRVDPQLLAVAEQSPLTISDTLESLIAVGGDSEDDRAFAYGLVADRPVHSAADAFARAAIAGRLAQQSGLGAPDLVAEVERFARMSRRLDPSFRNGAAQRMLGTLYVLAPAVLVEHGDSEDGLDLLIDLFERHPDDLQTRLRVAEAYVALNDEEPAHEHLCSCVARIDELRADERELLEHLLEAIEPVDCR
jgi:hypothetical protein